MKHRRSQRIVEIAMDLFENPRKLMTLGSFAEKYDSAKSSISEDLLIIKETIESNQRGMIRTIAGTNGGVIYTPGISLERANQIADEMAIHIMSQDRSLDGGYLYLNDVLANPIFMKDAAKIIATAFSSRQVDAVMTVATKGIPIGMMVANEFQVPLAIVRKDNRVTEGPTVNINYITGSSKRIQTMVLAKRSIRKGAHVLLIDDVMKAGGTIHGMQSLLSEFDATVAGIGVLFEAGTTDEKRVKEYLSILRIKNIDSVSDDVELQKGTYINYFGEEKNHENHSYQ